MIIICLGLALKVRGSMIVIVRGPLWLCVVGRLLVCCGAVWWINDYHLSFVPCWDGSR